MDAWTQFLSQPGNALKVVAGIIGLLTLIKAVIEYSTQNAQKRAEFFNEVFKEFLADESASEICNLLEDDEAQLEKISYGQKEDFLGLMERIALLTNTGLIRRDVSHYMFGYYAVKCWESKHFWDGENGVNREEHHWKLFRSYAEEMSQIAKSLPYNPKRLRF